MCLDSTRKRHRARLQIAAIGGPSAYGGGNYYKFYVVEYTAHRNWQICLVVNVIITSSPCLSLSSTIHHNVKRCIDVARDCGTSYYKPQGPPARANNRKEANRTETRELLNIARTIMSGLQLPTVVSAQCRDTCSTPQQRLCVRQSLLVMAQPVGVAEGWC